MSPPLSPARLSTGDSHVLVVDVQEKLLPRIDGGATISRNIAFVLDACRILEVPASGTEQYPRGLGPTVSELTSRLPAPMPEKLAFSCCAIPSVTTGFRASGRHNILVVGIETHVCVLQTVLDLLSEAFQVFVAVDAVGSRFAIDHQTALRRMEQAGAVLCTVETAVFEMTKQAGTPTFKAISTLVQERMRSLTQ